MDSMMPQSLGQAPFFFYSDPKMTSRQAVFQQQLAAAWTMATSLPPTPLYSRPNSSCSQPPTLYSNGPSVMTPSVMTPTGTVPHGMRKPSIMLKTEFADNSYFPPTPALSTSSSTVGSPKTCDILHTPINPMFSGLEAMGLKDTDSFFDWNSPPLSPVYFQSQLAKCPSLATTASDLSSACSSLSPSPTPAYARSIASEDVDFCDPRNLTVSAGSTNPTLAPEFTLSSDDLKNELSADAVLASQPFDFNSVLPSGLPCFEDLSDLDSEDDFANLVNLGDVAADISRPRACTGSSVVSLGHGSFITDEDLSFNDAEAFEFPILPSPPSSVDSTECGHRHKKQKRDAKKCSSKPVMNTAANGAQSGSEQPGANQAGSSGSDSNASSGSEEPAAALPAPTNRRGRKQSLTEDPSKTFVCDLCNRRFRRQEHLKRHYRSLHTQEKPFECNECGKKFSRSDNLAQHARTHAGGAIVMNLIEDADVSGFDTSMMSGPVGDDYNTFGKVLFQIASEVPGSASELSSDEGGDLKKKRKRAD